MLQTVWLAARLNGYLSVIHNPAAGYGLRAGRICGTMSLRASVCKGKGCKRMDENMYINVDEKMLKVIDEKMPPEEELQDLAEFFKVFGDATRLKILYVLLSAEMCVYDIAAVLNMSQSAISHQLRVLKQMDLVKNRREGKTVLYSLADGHIVTILSQGLDHIEE